MDAPTAIEVRRVKLSEDLMRPGDYVFIEKRDPKVTIEKQHLLPPEGFWKRLTWNLFGNKYELKQTIEFLWPEIDTVVIMCPACNGACGTTKNHRIVSIEPLTIETEITCPYCKDETFKVVEGKLIPA